MGFLSSLQGTSPIFLHPLVQEHCGHPSSHFQLTCSTWQLIPLLSILVSPSPTVAGMWSLPTCGLPSLGCPLCGNTVGAGESRGMGCSPESPDCLQGLLSPQTAVTDRGGLGLLVRGCSWHRRVALMLFGPQEEFVPDGSAACKLFATSLRKSCSFHVCRVAVVKLLSKERKSAF